MSKNRFLQFSVIFVATVVACIGINFFFQKLTLHSTPSNEITTTFGGFQVVESIDWPIDSERVFYNPRDIDSLQGVRLMTHSMFLDNLSYGVINGKETIGLLSTWNMYLHNGDGLIFQFTAYTDNTDEVELNFGIGKARERILLDDTPKYIYYYLSSTEDMTDVFFQIPEGAQVTIGDVYLVNYSNQFKRSNLLIGIFK